MLIDTSLLQSIANSLLLVFTSQLSKSVDLIDEIIQKKLYDLTNSPPFYMYQFKRFITPIALGMMFCIE